MPVLKDGEIILYGFVGDDFWDEGFTAREVIEALAAIGRDKDIVVRVNSGGGYVHEGIAIFNALEAHKGSVTIHIDAIAASAASVIAMAGDQIIMRSGALMMIHDPSTHTFGNAIEHEKSRHLLDKLADQMAVIYAERSGGDAKKIRVDMRQEIWLNGEEAVEQGYADQTDDAKAHSVAAFDYRFYHKAPAHLHQAASLEGWSFARPKTKAEKPTIASIKEPPKMTEEPSPRAHPYDNPYVKASSAADERARIKAIMHADEAKDCLSLAEHYAFDTDAPVGAALAAMKAAAADHARVETEKKPPDKAEYQEQRLQAQALAQPEANATAPTTAVLNIAEIYAARRQQEGTK